MDRLSREFEGQWAYAICQDGTISTEKGKWRAPTLREWAQVSQWLALTAMDGKAPSESGDESAPNIPDLS